MLETDIKTLQDRFQQGHYISNSGIELSFKTNRKYGHDELESYFHSLGISKETEYFKFIDTFGACDIFGQYDDKDSKSRILIQSI